MPEQGNTQLEGYDCLLDELRRYEERLGLVVEAQEFELPMQKRNAQILENLGCFEGEWLAFVEATKRRFGIVFVERALRHLGLNEFGKTIVEPFSGP